ncbi:glyoxalase [Rhizobium mesosinicum]|uniref:Glyoxalase n=2 Tax=Rhizobium mesosinicum TaxID=335017 RepID=A0ABS7GM15_9HYPH|nr:glyoxalase [Rhizobium mesosinicum]
MVASATFLATNTASAATARVGVGSQYSTTHVYVAPNDVDKFAESFLATFGGKSTKQVIATVTPTDSSTTSQLLQTPAGTVSLFGFTSPIPYPFGHERTGYLVTDLDKAVTAAVSDGAEVIVAPFDDPIGRDAVIQWPGGVKMQLYWHKTPPTYEPFATLPENRVYLSKERLAAFVRGFLAFSHGRVVSDETQADGNEIGQPGKPFHRIRIESDFGRLAVMATDGHLPYPYGWEVAGYEVNDLNTTLEKATASGASVVVPPVLAGKRKSAIVGFPGGYIAEIHATQPE